MFKKIKNFVLVGLAVLTLGAPALLPAMASANSIQQNLCQGTNIATGSTSTDCSANAGTSSLASLATKIVNLLSIVVGVVAVIMIIFGGFRYITSGGDSGHVTSAKSTLIYAIVGLIVVALAQFIVHFVLTNVPQ
ncbi:MAG TPA: pilin [Candidatus Dormibacteraeota bacterium]|nr:pilin [Candidatus Dormibacteraeota bacterium]